MNVLLPCAKKFEEIKATIGLDSPIFPNVVLVGSQGSGKSCVIETILGHSFLHHDTAPATRCPILIHLKHANKGPDTVEFYHRPRESFSDWEQIEEEVQREMQRNAGPMCNISAKPVIMKIHGPNYVDATFVDLPGLSQSPQGDQPKDIGTQLRKLALRYMRMPNTVILAVVSSTESIPNSDCFLLARLVDSSGSRTIVVLTKLDLLNPAVDLTSTLNGQEIGSFRKFIGVVCKTEKSRSEKKKFEDMAKKEKKILQSKYPQIAREHGISALRLEISLVLRDHLRALLPEFKQALTNFSKMSLKSAEEMIPCQDMNKVILEEITRYVGAFSALLNGTKLEVELETVVGGAKISHILQEVFPKTVDSVDPLAGLSRSQILTALKNTSGTRPDLLFIPEICFENLARRQIAQLKWPCKMCVNLVYDVLAAMASDSNSLLQSRYPTLYYFISVHTQQLMLSSKNQTSELVDDILEMELGYINTQDAEFRRQVDASKVAWLTSRGLINIQPNQDERNKNSVEVSEQGKPLLSSSSSSSSWLSSLLIGGEAVTPSLPPETGIIRITSREDEDCQLIENLLVSYVNAVSRSLKDSVPKAIMLRMVNYVQNHLYHILMERMEEHRGKEENMLKEPEHVQQRREAIATSEAALLGAERELASLERDLKCRL